MQPRARACMGLVLFLLALFLASGCTQQSAPATVVCIGEEYSAYPEIIQTVMPAFTISTERGAGFSFLRAGKSIEAFDIQAVSALENNLAAYWYPHYLATVVIAVDRGQTDATIAGWYDLLTSSETVTITDNLLDRSFMLAAIAYGVEGEGFNLKSGARLLERLQAEKRLVQKCFTAPVVICYDYQAAALNKAGREIEIVIPREGTLAYAKGLLSGAQLTISDDIEPLLISQGYRLLDGRCDERIFASPAAYERALVLCDFVHLSTALEDAARIFEREVLHTHLYTTADDREHQFFALCYMVLIILWTDSVVRRAAQKGVRRGALSIGAILLGWAGIRLIRYQLDIAGVASRYLWYSYYLFQLSLPLALLWLAWGIDKSEEERLPPKWLWVLSAYNVIALALVYTNDLHNLVFRFDLANTNLAYEYGYGLGFLFVAASWTVQVVITIIILVTKSGHTPRKKRFLLPLASCGLLFLYGAGYIARIAVSWDSDYTMVVGATTLLFMEICMRIGLIPVNTKYVQLFTHSPLNMLITDQAGAAVLSSATATAVDESLFKSALASSPWPAGRDENTLLYAKEIAGGHALWQEDISNVNSLYVEIKESVRQLAVANNVLARREVVQRALNEESVKIQLMEQLEGEIAEHILRLSTMIEKNDGACGGKDTGRIVLLLCYIKRRCNLFFRQRETEALPATEISAYVQELADMAKYSALNVLVTGEVAIPITPKQAIIIYDLFYAVTDWAAKNKHFSLLACFEPAKESSQLRLLLSDTARCFELDHRLAAAIDEVGGAYVRKDLDGATGISLVFLERGGNDG